MIKSPIYNGIAQSDLDMAGFNLLNFSGGGGGGGSAVQGRIVSVKDAPYNATGDGVTDDTVAIQAAINAMVAAGGGTVFFPRGIYLCNGAFDSTFKSILKIPYINNATTSPVTLTLMGEDMPSWSVVGFPQDYSKVSTIKTTRTDGMTADATGFAAVIAGNAPYGNVKHSVYADFNGCMILVKNMAFICPDNPTMGGIRFDGMGWAFLENVTVNGGFAVMEPTHGTTGVWMPNSINWSISYANHVTSSGFDTGVKCGELLHAPFLEVYYCKVGVAFTEGADIRGHGQIGMCIDGIKFLGYAQVDFFLSTETTGSGWNAVQHHIKDPSNYGGGRVVYQIAHGNVGDTCNTLAIEGGSGLTLIDQCSGNVRMNTTAGSAGGPSLFTGRVFATEFWVGFTDVGLQRTGANAMKVTDGSTGMGTIQASTVYIGTDARLVSISGGAKLQARNTGTGLWADVDQWTNP